MVVIRGLVLCSILTCRLFAHDFWIEPSSFHPALGEPLHVALRVGEQFKGEPVKRNPERFEKFVTQTTIVFLP